METFVLVNGFAGSKPFERTLDEAIKSCEHDSNFMNTRFWLYQKIGGEYKEIGHTVLDGYSWRYIATK